MEEKRWMFGNNSSDLSSTATNVEIKENLVENVML